MTGPRRSGAGAPVEIRPFEERDAPAVEALWHEAFPDDPPRNEPSAILRRKLGTQRDLLLVATLDGAVVGAVVAGYDGFRGWLYHLAVRPDQRRRGTGRSLVEAVEVRMRGLGCPKLNLQVRARNAAVVAFYERLGYAVEDHVSMGKLLERSDE